MKRRKRTQTAAERTRSRGLDQRRKLDIIGLLLMLFGVLLLLALVSYRSADESVADIGLRDYLRLFGGDPDIQARADVTGNWLGLFGALIATFFIRSTIGYFSLLFPALLIAWGWFVFRGRDLRALAYYTNALLGAALLFATLCGLFRLVTWLPPLPFATSGAIGDFCAGILARLIGHTGGILAALTALVILAVVTVDYDIRKTARRIRATFAWLRAHAIPSRPVGETPLAPVEAPVDATSDRNERRRTRADAGAPATAAERETSTRHETAPAARPPRPAVQATTFSIARPGAAGTATGAPAFGNADAPRSNGVIPLESIAGLREVLEEYGTGLPPRVPPEPARYESAAAAGPETTDRETPGPVHGSAAPSQVRAIPMDDAAPAAVRGLEDAERRALRRSVAQTLAGPSELDSEEVNASLAALRIPYTPPPADLLDASAARTAVTDAELHTKAALVKEKLAVFGIDITSISVTPGPVVTLFELVPDSSVKISKITALADDLALALAARGIRIIAPIPGKSAVGIEIPNNEPEIVSFRSIAASPVFQHARHHLPLGLGKSIEGEVYCDDLARMPHLLIAGATGAGKSVGVNVMIASLLYRLAPQDVRFVLIDPKKIELAPYRGLSRHFLAACPDVDEEIITDPANAVVVLKSLEIEMDMRYTKLAKAGVRHVADYNAKVRTGALSGSDGLKHYRLPYIVVVIDELADLMITAAREVEEPIARLAQLARAVGIHLVVATQRPSVDVLTGVIKANFSARIAYQVASRVDSRTILDAGGADQLLGNGDMLYLPSGSPKAVRIQNAYISTGEVERIVDYVAGQPGYDRPYALPSVRLRKKHLSRQDDIEGDDLLREAALLIVRHQQGSVSLLQRRLKIGYSRAARIVDQLETAGIVGPSDGSKARDVLVEHEDQVEDLLQEIP